MLCPDRLSLEPVGGVPARPSPTVLTLVSTSESGSRWAPDGTTHEHAATMMVICALAAEFGLETAPLSASAATSNQYSPVVRDGLVHEVPVTPVAAAV